MTQSFKNMRSYLSKLQIYNLSVDSYITHELHAYDIGFKYVEDMINELEREMSINTAESYGLCRWEKILFGDVNEQLDAYDRRKMIISALQVDESYFTCDGISKALGAVGIDAQVKEFLDEERITVTAMEYRGGNFNTEYINRRLETIVPAHLDFTLDMGVFSWAIFDQYNFDFELWDSKDITWEYFEKEGHSLA